MIGYIDRLARTADGRWQIHDYKTNSSLPTQADKDADPQLAYYEIGIRRMWKDVERVELIWHFLRFDHSIVSTRTADQLNQLRAEAISTITDIERRGDEAERFPTSEGPLCSYCEYQQLCPARKHLYQVRVMPENELAKEPAVALVDRWAELDAKRKLLQDEQGEIEGQIEELRQALIAIGQRDGLELIAGREKEVTISVNDRVLFPRKGQEPEKAEALETALRSTPWWAQLSSLNSADLRAAWESADTNPDLRRILEKFVWTERETSARLRARRDRR
jgi:putative RecB family exonuclease